MFRKGIILLVFLYLIPTIGITISVHYCGNKITSFSLTHFSSEHNCPCGSKKMKKNCCSNEVTVIKIDDNQLKSQDFDCSLVKKLNLGWLTTLHTSYNTILIQANRHIITTSHPPDVRGVLPFILNQVFRI